MINKLISLILIMSLLNIFEMISNDLLHNKSIWLYRFKKLIDNSSINNIGQGK